MNRQNRHPLPTRLISPFLYLSFLSPSLFLSFVSVLCPSHSFSFPPCLISFLTLLSHTFPFSHFLSRYILFLHLSLSLLPLPQPALASSYSFPFLSPYPTFHAPPVSFSLSPSHFFLSPSLLPLFPFLPPHLSPFPLSLHRQTWSTTN